MLRTQLNSQQHLIVKDICDEQIQTLIKVSMQPINEISLNEKANGISELLISFSNLKQQPNKVFELDSDSYSLFKHSLLNNDKRYRTPLANALCNLWEKIIVRDNFKMVMS